MATLKQLFEALKTKPLTETETVLLESISVVVASGADADLQESAYANRVIAKMVEKYVKPEVLKEGKKTVKTDEEIVDEKPKKGKKGSVEDTKTPKKDIKKDAKDKEPVITKKGKKKVCESMGLVNYGASSLLFEGFEDEYPDEDQIEFDDSEVSDDGDDEDGEGDEELTIQERFPELAAALESDDLSAAVADGDVAKYIDDAGGEIVFDPDDFSERLAEKLDIDREDLDEEKAEALYDKYKMGEADGFGVFPPFDAIVADYNEEEAPKEDDEIEDDKV